MKEFYPLLMLIMTVGLAFIGGLAVACFTKVNSIMFLGSPRSEPSPFRFSGLSLAAMSWLAALCVWIGIYPQSFLSLLIPALTPLGIAIQHPMDAFESIWVFNGLFTGLFIIFVIAFFVKLHWVRIRGQRVTRVWACGYRRLSARMQYTASSYADELNSLAERFLHIRKHIHPPDSIFPQTGHFSSHADDYSERRIARPVYRFVSSLVRLTDFINQTDIRYYIAFILITIVIYSFLAFVWTL
jgi:hydrogenase-4 component B